MHRHPVENLTLVGPDPVAGRQLAAGVVGEAGQHLDVDATALQGPRDDPCLRGRTTFGVVPLGDHEYSQAHAVAH